MKMIQSAEYDLGDRSAVKGLLVSIVVPAFNEAANLPILHERIVDVLNKEDFSWELIIVDDHSRDTTFSVVQDLSRSDPRVRGYRLSQNCGSHTATRCGLESARGQCAVVIPADLQDPPELIPELVKTWQAGAQVVWAVRNRRAGEGLLTKCCSRLYYFLMRRIVGFEEMAITGADSCLIDRCIISALKEFGERNINILALITWVGFRQNVIRYDKQARRHGSSGWSLEKKIKLAVDSVTSFSYLPIRLILYAGFVVSLAGFLYAGLIVWNALYGHPPQGWASLMVAVLVLGGVQMLMIGTLGEYLWRALDETRRRPRYLIEAIADPTSSVLTADSVTASE